MINMHPVTVEELEATSIESGRTKDKLIE